MAGEDMGFVSMPWAFRGSNAPAPSQRARALERPLPGPILVRQEGGVAERALTLARAAGEVAAETLWPSRCAVCGALGQVLCEECRKGLPYIDQWRSCPRCGAPFGMHQCTECNTFSLRGLGREKVPYAGCVSAVAFDGASARIVRLRKDAGDRALARPMAFAIACAVPPGWLSGLQVTYVPSTKQALRKRGFCHARELAEEVAELLGIPCATLLSVPRSS
ncbi:MAG: ComF family protein, partial [Eggerthellaceae bacterium]|nr:ComF family protein [Eggerthellaceae bacterium]